MAFADPDPLRGIVLKVCSVTVFVAMQTCIKLAGDGIPSGQITFHRSAFAILPILVYLAWRGELRQAMQTDNPLGHIKRGLLGVCAMGTGFYGLVHLPLPDAIAMGYAMPLLAVVFAAVFLKETVRLYRWTAVVVGLVALAGFFGGLGQIFLTESYRYADVSTIAPFEYCSIILGSIAAYILFSEVPTMTTLIGAAIVVAAGIFIIYREHQLGLERRAARKASTPQG
ncbi:DMT family transporter [Rhizobium rhizophilum]|uniref:DMT family transporter n=1 Tax=Rhizobium rhizophilum TaxID=1850373 RepID=A0ABY2QV20_9HYPH|nr:DMT family transporter [Rhizobium rhizophilum]THV14178.1 DMT family transporter [Rhizobium rhizophilum]